MARIFGTNGVRGIVGDTMTAAWAHRLGRAVGTWLPAGSQIGLGGDARVSGSMLRLAFASGVLEEGVHVIDIGIIASPGAQLFVRNHALAAGAIVTASHNPPEWNGIKLVSPDGTETSREQEDEVEAIFASNKFRTAAWNEVGQYSTADAEGEYIAAVMQQVDVEAIAAANIRVVVDAGGGAGAQSTPRLLRQLGVEVVALSCEFDGSFSDRPSEPTEQHAARCMEAVRSHSADFGVLHDGDADRTIFIDEEGHYVWGDQTLALAARHELPRHGNRMMCTAISSSTCVVDGARLAGGEVAWTAVGSPVVAREMIRLGAPFGGEDNGGLMFARHQYCRDGLMAAAFMAELVAVSKQPLSQLLQEIPRYALVKQKIAVPDNAKELVLAKFAKKVSKLGEIDDRDGVKIFLDNGWALVRPSGTEPIFRIQAEAKTAPEANAIAAKFRAILEEVTATLKTVRP